MSNFPTEFKDHHDINEKIMTWFKDPLNQQAYSAVDRVKERLTNYYGPHDFMMGDFNLIVDMVSEELHKLAESKESAK
jgi:hypothetical protein